MNLVDSSGWLEYFADGPQSRFFAPPLEDVKNLVVPSICIFEVFKKILQQRTEDAALRAVSLMQQAMVIPLDVSISLLAAKLSYEHKLPMADSIILATARHSRAILWTKDTDFKGLENVKLIEK